MMLIAYRNAVIEKGIASIQDDKSLDDWKKQASLNGFGMSRSLNTIDEYDDEIERRTKYSKQNLTGREYWEYRWATIQMEWVRDALVASEAINHRLNRSYSVRSALLYAQIVGIKN